MDLQIEEIGGGDNDLAIVGGDLVRVGGDASTWGVAVAQRVRYELGTWLGESAFDRGKGFPWADGVFGRQPIDGIASLFYDAIASVEGIDGIVGQPDLRLDTVTRRLTGSIVADVGGFEVPITLAVKAPESP